MGLQTLIDWFGSVGWKETVEWKAGNVGRLEVRQQRYKIQPK